MQKSSTGLPAHIAAILCYLLGWISGLVFYLIEKESDFVRFHATQAIITFGALTVVSLLIQVLPLLGQLIGGLLSLLGLALWIILMIKAALKERFKLPYIGDWAEEYARKKIL
ncbi:MAG: DUF4870 domain-containing protein [Desulfobacterales bacterium]|nr:DUF4870 domain-containing protein [Desulfobacterales bacterium]MDJ0874464.1 DUF4870 domain-containing protein [Desulfobacterales bacterium]MDJ0883475.1 DUF4870 domain-containing protein [Desulfobacterales bacterium]